MKKNIKRGFIGLTCAIASVAFVLTAATSAGAAGVEYTAPRVVKAAAIRASGQAGYAAGNTAEPVCSKGSVQVLINRCFGWRASTPPAQSAAPTPSVAPSQTPSTQPSPSKPAATPAPLASAKPSATAAPSATPTPKPAATPAPSAATTPTANPSSGSDYAAMESKMVALINSERSAAGFPALEVNVALTKMARVKSQDMVTNSYFSHTSPTYGSPFDMLNQFGISYRTAGENIAMNQSVSAAHTSLMNSEGHRRNILNPGYTQIGIGIVSDGHAIYISLRNS